MEQQLQATIAIYYGVNGTVILKPFPSSCCDPSRADAEINDPTITRCINFARSWGYGRLEVVNLFAYRTSKPFLLKQAAEPIGKDNDRFILESIEKCVASQSFRETALS